MIIGFLIGGVFAIYVGCVLFKMFTYSRLLDEYPIKRDVLRYLIFYISDFVYQAYRYQSGDELLEHFEVDNQDAVCYFISKHEKGYHIGFLDSKMRYFSLGRMATLKKLSTL